MNKDVKAYLIHSYLYYKLNEPVISDTEYDMLCKELLNSGVEHPLISKEDLAAGTGYSIAEYPSEIIKEAEKLLSSAQALPNTEVAASYKPKVFSFTCTPAETYLLLGMYVDYGYAKQRDAQKVIQAELRRRWSGNIHRSEFLSYFKDHNVGPHKFGLAS